jgi:hypothetical protein
MIIGESPSFVVRISAWFTIKVTIACHSERSEESLKKTASSWRFFASLRMTWTKVFIKC